MALYETLLRGLANEAQDQLCAADKQHAWGEWVCSVLRHDFPTFTHPHEEPIDAVMRVRSQRQCLNCGKVEHLKD